ncbi:MAG: site-specific integrase [Actinomycetota bacterium]|nr:site-specific integrase [Actinomycetota bacterium]
MGDGMRAFMVKLPSGVRYWTVVDDALLVVADADAYLRHLRLGRDAAELTTKSYAGAIALFFGWCEQRDLHWHGGVEHIGLFMVWLRHSAARTSGSGGGEGVCDVLAGPGSRPVRSARRVNVVLTAVRGLVTHAVASGVAPAGLVPLLYEVADEADLPEQARQEDGRIPWRLRARHRLHEPDPSVNRASDDDIVALLRACRSARDRLIVLLMARAGLRRGEVCGLRRSDVHLAADSRALRCEVDGPHLHVARRDNPNQAWAKSRRERVVPLDALAVRAFDTYELERLAHPEASASDFLVVNLFREPLGAPVRPDAINELLRAASRRAGLEVTVAPHQLRHAFGSNLADAGGALDVIADLLGHRSMTSSQGYLHPDPARLRRAVEAVRTPRAPEGVER